MDVIELLLVMVLLFGSITVTVFMSNKTLLVKFLRNFTKRNYGLVFILGYGKALYPMISNLSKAVIKDKRNHRIWIVEENKVYRLVRDEKFGDNGSSILPGLNKNKIPFVKKLKHNILPQDISYKGGVPCLFFDIEDMKPLRFQNDKFESGTRNPVQVEATLSKEIAAAEALALKQNKKEFKKYLLMILVMTFVCIGIGMIVFMRQGEVSGQLLYINQTITSICGV